MTIKRRFSVFACGLANVDDVLLEVYAFDSRVDKVNGYITSIMYPNDPHMPRIIDIKEPNGFKIAPYIKPSKLGEDAIPMYREEIQRISSIVVSMPKLNTTILVKLENDEFLALNDPEWGDDDAYIISKDNKATPIKLKLDAYDLQPIDVEYRLLMNELTIKEAFPSALVSK